MPARQSPLTVSFLLGLALLLAPAGRAPCRAADPQEWVDEHLPQIASLYKHFHRHPELSFQEAETAERLAGELEKLGFEVTTGVGGHGVVGLLENGKGPTVMVRTDLDALPVTEKTGLPYASEVTVETDEGNEVGVMHACGHDVHIANLVGVARYLSEHTGRWSGTLMVIGQPAEERGAGAKAMLADGLFERFPKPDYALALHVDPELATGRVGYRAGYALANVDSVDITVRGRGGHGAHPDTTIDPVVQAAQLVLDLQTIVSREIKPLEPAVVTVGSIHGGTKHNIISDECHLQLTVRSYTDKVRYQLKEAIIRKAKAVAESYRAPEPEIDYSIGTPAMYNDPELVERILPVYRNALGEKNVVEAEQSMGGEDFSRYGRVGVPIFMFRLGSTKPERLKKFEEEGTGPPSLHSPFYYPDPSETLRTGVVTMASAVLELLAPQNGAAPNR